MKEIRFKTKAAQRIYADYMSRLKTSVKGLNKDDQLDTLMEFNSHIYEATNKSTDSSEVDTLLDILEKLGKPDDVLKPLIADKMLNKATRTFNPIDVFKAIALNIGNGISYILFAILYLLLLTGIFLIVAKLIYYSTVGFYVQNKDIWVLGPAPNDTAVEMLGHWFIPVIGLFIITLYFIITLLLKLKRSITQK